MQEEPHSILRIGKRVNAVRQGPDGLRYGFTDESNGRLMRSLPDGNAASPRAPRV
jgi:glucose/arabinose dehydrogenase